MASPLKLRPGMQPSLRPAPNPRMERLRARVRAMPQEPGVYRWIDDRGEIIYVGKAKNLRQRLRSYVAPTPRVEHYRKRALLENMADLDVTFCSTEMEALMLEMHLIRSLKPRYNVSLARESHYVYVRVGDGETFPSITLTHARARDGARYYGPYADPWSQRRTLEILRSVYGFRTCSMRIDVPAPALFEERPLSIPLQLTISKADRRAPCLDYHIRQCSGPCTGDFLPADYRRDCIDPAVAYYEGRPEHVLAALTTRMDEAVRHKLFERAADTRDALGHLEEMSRRRKLFDPHAKRIDAFGFARGMTSGTVLQVRGGNLANEERLSLSGSEHDGSAAIAQILTQFYASSDDIPDVIALPAPPENLPLINGWLSKEADHAVKIAVPKRGELHRLTRLAATNAQRAADAAAELSLARTRVYSDAHADCTNVRGGSVEGMEQG